MKKSWEILLKGTKANVVYFQVFALELHWIHLNPKIYIYLLVNIAF